MEEIERLSYQLNPLKVQRRNVVQVCKFTVKSLIDKSCYETIDADCAEMINFLATMEKLLNHRLKPNQTWYGMEGPRSFWEYIKVACRKVPHNCLSTIQSIETIKTPTGKGRAWLRAVLMEKRLSEYIAVALSQPKITKAFYHDGSVLLSDEAPMLSGILLALNAIDFSFDLKGEILDYGTYEVDYTPYLKFNQSVDNLNDIHMDFQDDVDNNALDNMDDSEIWRRKYVITEVKYRNICEQKGYLEELVRLRESQLEEVHKQRQKVIETMHYYEADRRRERQQLEGVIIELQAQMTSMKAEHRLQVQQMEASLQRFSCLSANLAPPPGASIPMTDMTDIMAPRPDTIGKVDNQDRNDYLAAGPYLDNGNHSADCKSILSGNSTQSAATREETQSLVPMTGSFTSDTVSVKSNETHPQQQLIKEQVTASNQTTGDMQPRVDVTSNEEADSIPEHVASESTPLLSKDQLDEGEMSDERNTSTDSSDNGFEVIHGNRNGQSSDGSDSAPENK